MTSYLKLNQNFFSTACNSACSLASSTMDSWYIHRFWPTQNSVCPNLYMQLHQVLQKENKLIFPRNVLKERGNRAQFSRYSEIEKRVLKCLIFYCIFLSTVRDVISVNKRRPKVISLTFPRIYLGTRDSGGKSKPDLN